MLFSFCAIVSAIILSAVHQKNGKTFFPIIFFISALGGGFLVSLSFNAAGTAWSGLPFEKVTAIKGKVVSDSRRLASGRYMAELELSEVNGRFGASAGAGGNIIIFFNSDPHIFKGELLSAITGLDASDEFRLLLKQQRAGEYSLLKNEAVFWGMAAEGGITRFGWSSKAFAFRASLMKMILHRCEHLAAGSGGLFAALFTGSRDGLSAEEVRIFREAGCSHILALSGMHLAIISGIILLVLKPLPGRKPAFIISALIILGYLYLTGFGISLVRAAVMYFIGGFAAVFYRKVSGIHVLIISFIILVIIEPASFYTLSFQLSFLAVGGILLLSPRIDRLLRPYMPRFFSMAIACSIAAQIFVTPILIKAFGALYPVGIASGIIIAPMVTVFIWAGIIYLITGAGFVSIAAGYLYRLIFHISGRAADLPSINTEGAEVPVLISCGIITAALMIYSIYRSKVDGISG